MTRQDKTRQDKTTTLTVEKDAGGSIAVKVVLHVALIPQTNCPQDSARQDKIRQDYTRQYKTRHDKT